MTARDPRSFQKFEHVLRRVLAQLVRRGYVVQPADGLDLVHDFYLEAWPSLHERFDSQRKSDFEHYVYGAFYRFARRRIVELARWKIEAVDVNELLLPDESSPEDAVEADIRTRHFMHGLQQLSESERRFLVAFLKDANGSERALARAWNVSRYQVHKQLEDLMARLATLTRSSAETDFDADAMALALWSNGVDAREAAAASAIPLEVFTHRQQHYLALLLDAIEPNGKKRTARRMSMKPEARTEPTPENALGLLKRALLSAGNEKLLKQVRARAKEIVENLEASVEDFSEQERKQIEREPEWLAAVYDAIAAVDDEGDETEDGRAISEAIEALHADERTEILSAFDSLLQSIPRRMLDWDSIFAGLPELPEEIQARLRNEWSIVPQTRASGLIKYGLTPGVFFDAIEGISLLTGRLLEPEGPDTALCLELELRSCSMYPQRTDLLLAQMNATPGLPAEAAGPLLRWLGKVAALRPYLFGGYRVVNWSEGSFELVPDATHEDAELLQRWTAFEEPESRGQRYSARRYEYQ